MNTEQILLQRDTAEVNFYLDGNDRFNILMKVSNFAREFCVLNLNVRRVADLDKFEDFVHYVESLEVEPDLIVLTETWVLRGTGGLYALRGYKGHHCGRELPSAGVALYVKGKYDFEVIDQSNGALSFI